VRDLPVTPLAKEMPRRDALFSDGERLEVQNQAMLNRADFRDSAGAMRPG
jgi:hypothetical protein